MLRHINASLNNQGGSAVFITLVALIAVTAIGILATRTAYIEHQIAYSDKFFKMTWYATDAVTSEMTPELIERAIREKGLTAGPLGTIEIVEPDFYMNPVPSTCEERVASPTNRDFYVPQLGSATVSARVYRADTEFMAGNSLELEEGYAGRGKTLAKGGVFIDYFIRGLGQGPDRSKGITLDSWRHVP
jgi:hypothetical protein